MKKNVYLAQMSMEIPNNKYYYLPYSAGVVWSYALTNDTIRQEYSLAELLFRQEPINDIVNRLENPSVFGLSTYVWNTNYNHELAKAIKFKWPDCKIILGGPDVDENDPDYFLKHPYIDFLIYREGEISFLNLLLSFLNLKDYHNIPGISFPNLGKRVTTGNSVRINDLTNIPSPYIIGLFDDILEKYHFNPNSDIIINPIFETNRGCPFMCTFCDWGGTTFSKVKKFDLTRVKEEIEWFGKNKFEFIAGTDANFGIFKERDLAITDLLISTKEKYGYPQIFDVPYTKNMKSETVEIANRLSKAGMMKRFTASFQSLNPETLDAIKRKNLNGKETDDIIQQSVERGIVVNTEMILGLPEETVDSWKSGFCELTKKGFTIETYPVMVLKNSEMNDNEYKKKHKIKTKKVKSVFSNYVDEWEYVIVETKTISEEEMRHVWLWTWFTNNLEGYGFTNLISRYLEKHHKIKMDQFYENLIKTFLKDKESVCYPYLVRWSNYAKDCEYRYFTSGYSINREPIEDLGQKQRKKFFNELYIAIKNMIVSEDTYLQQVINLQEKLQQQNNQEKHLLVCSANLYEYVQFDNVDLIKKETTYKIENQPIEERFNNDWFTFINYYKRSGGWKNEVQRIN